MAVKLGSSAVSLYLGDQSVTGYLGSQIVTATVPGAPTNVVVTYSETMGVASVSASFSPPSSDGGSPVLGYLYYVNGNPVLPANASEGAVVFGTGTVQLDDVIEISAFNAIGEGPKSEPVTVA